jgi:hypothetical protein
MYADRLAAMWKRWVAAWVAAGCGIFAGVSCSVPETGAGAFVSVVMRRGDLVWRPDAGGAAGFEAVFARAASGEVAVDLYRGGPEPVAVIRLKPDGYASVHGAAGNWRGPRARAPRSLDPLLVLAALYGSEESLPDGMREIHTAETKSAVTVRSGRLDAGSVASMDGPASASVRFW